VTDSNPSTPAPSAKPPAPAPPASPPLTLSTLGTLVGVVGLTLIGVVLYSQERTIGELQRDLANLRGEQQKLAAELTGRNGAVNAEIDVKGAPALGPADATVTLIEFSDYECPFCIRHFTTTMPEIRKSYIETGKIRYVFKDFPIDSNHPMAIRAHEAAHCAMEQQRFWPLHMKLFSAPGTHTPDQLIARATEAGLDVTRFKACIASGRTDAAIKDSVSLAEQLSADGTPMFFIGTRDLATDRVHVVKVIDGAQPFSAFQQALDELIKP
jgi:protein-disulfide isomerase